jgi:hypothetical protein
MGIRPGDELARAALGRFDDFLARTRLGLGNRLLTERALDRRRGFGKTSGARKLSCLE